MRRHQIGSNGPACADELLLLLRSSRLVEEAALSRLGAAWNGSDPPQTHLDELVQAGLLTPYQAEQIRLGRVRHLRLGPYRLLDRLGQAVYKAEHRLLGRLVVLKVLGRSRRRRGNAEPVTTSSQRRQTPAGSLLRQSCREIQALGRLSHPHLVAAHDACWIRGRLVLVLEHIEGVDVSRMIEQCGPLPVDLARNITYQTALALEYLHQSGMVHRDVKPANLLLAHGLEPGGQPLVKLLDLGLVCQRGIACEELSGTPNYMAPERAEASNPIDIRGDLYSLGCSLYEMLTGRVPYPGGTWHGKLLRHRIEVPTHVAELRPEVPPELAGLVGRLMARQAADRPATPAEVCKYLDQAGQARQAPPQLPSPKKPQKLPVKSNKPLASLANLRWLVCTAAVLGLSLGCLLRWLPARNEPVPASTAGTGADPSQPVRENVTVVGANASYPDLATAIACAEDGAVIELPAGDHAIGALRIAGKSLTLRASSGSQTLLHWAAEPRPWDALISSDRQLTLENVNFVGVDNALAPLILVEGGGLSLKNCRLEQRGTAPAVSFRRGTALQLQNCRIRARDQGVAVEVDGKDVVKVGLFGTEIEVRDPTGLALLLWSPEVNPGGRADVRLHENRIKAGRVCSCRSVAGAIRIDAVANQFTFDQALASFEGYDFPNDWRRVLRWTGRENRCDASGAWVRLEGRSGPIWSEQAWNRLWSEQSAKLAPTSGIRPASVDSSLRPATQR